VICLYPKICAPSKTPAGMDFGPQFCQSTPDVRWACLFKVPVGGEDPRERGGRKCGRGGVSGQVEPGWAWWAGLFLRRRHPPRRPTRKPATKGRPRYCYNKTICAHGQLRENWGKEEEEKCLDFDSFMLSQQSAMVHRKMAGCARLRRISQQDLATSKVCIDYCFRGKRPYHHDPPPQFRPKVVHRTQMAGMVIRGITRIEPAWTTCGGETLRVDGRRE